MTLRKSRFAPWVLGLVVVGSIAAFGGACSGQGEGERCSTQADNNGDDDCAGLKCWPAGQLNGSSTDRCCPADRTQATTPVCAVQTATGIDAGGPVDSGSVTDTGATEGGDAAKDSAGGDTGASDGGSDAPLDG